jgi:hypothetical protein
MDKFEKIDRLQELASQLRETARAVEQVSNIIYTNEGEMETVLYMLNAEFDGHFDGARLETDCMYLKIKPWMVEE